MAAMRRRSIEGSRVLRRRRARRILSAFIKRRFEAVKPVGVFHASHVEWMLRSGKPDDAHHYLECFLHRIPVLHRVRSPQSIQLIAHVGVFKTLAKVVAGGEEGDAVAAMFANPSEYFLRSPASVRLNKMIAVMHADHTRASQLWEHLKPQALDTIMDLVARCPELQDEARLPRERTLACDASPNGLLHYPGRRWKTTKRASAGVLIREFLQKRSRMTHRIMLPEFSSSASSSVTSNRKTGQIAQKPINHAAPGVDATVVAAMLGRKGNLGHKAGAGVSKSRKRKMSATPETHTEASTSTKIWE